MRIKQKQKALLDALGNRFTTIEYDGGYLLLDKEQKATLTQQSYGKYIAKIYLSSDGDYYVYQDVRYKDKDTLLTAIEEYNATLPFSVEIYNPSFIPSYRIEAGLSQYLRSLGFVHDWGTEGYTLKDAYGISVCNIVVDVDRDSTNGKVTKVISSSQWQDAEFTDLTTAVAAVNSLISLSFSCLQAQTMNVLKNMTSSRVTKILDHKLVNNGMEEYITNAKDEAIAYLEQELKRLKEE